MRTNHHRRRQNPPAITCPGDVTVSCASEAPAVNTAAVTTSDNCGATPAVSHAGDIPSGACPAVVTRTYEAQDACGNTKRCAQTITVDDKTPPAITCPGDVTVSCASEAPAVNTAAVTTSDNCGATPAVTHAGDIPSGACPAVVTRTYEAQDACGNTKRCAQTITVDDKTPPAITCPAGTTVSCSSEIPEPGSLAASDNCGDLVIGEFVRDSISGQACDNRFMLTRFYRATDACGNSATCTQIIRVYDKTAPSINCPANLEVPCTSDVPVADPGTVVAGDNCAGAVVTFHMGDAVNDYTCPNNYRLIRMYRAFDACGNSNSCFQSILVNDQTPPALPVPINITVSCIKNIPCDGSDPNMAAAMEQIKSAFVDECGGAMQVAYLSNDPMQSCTYQGGVGYTYYHTFHFMVTDACGNATAYPVTFSGACFCTYTQGFWGNPNGKANGLTSTQILDTLMKYGPILVGDGQNCGFAVATTSCVLGILPGGGPSTPLDKGYKLVCNKAIKNTLVGQLVALQLNIRYNAHFRDLHLESMVLAESCAVLPAQLTALGLADTSTVLDLIKLANTFLSSKCTGKTYANGYGGQLTTALTALNEYWDECKSEIPCEEEEPVSGERTSGVMTASQGAVRIAPNPAFSIVSIRFEAATEGAVNLRIFNTAGRLMDSRILRIQNGENTTVIDVSGYGPGMYWVSLYNDEMAVQERFVVYRD
ncbi:MAG: T9SS type A sorting domain-containing protein [Saprospirales bacterium]|nr:T9SS type A sorting domain-containing protein [Saprospirales bacterium]